MPLARYFLVVGGVLLSLLFVLDYSSENTGQRAWEFVQPVIRIYSDPKAGPC